MVGLCEGPWETGLQGLALRSQTQARGAWVSKSGPNRAAWTQRRSRGWGQEAVLGGRAWAESWGIDGERGWESAVQMGKTVTVTVRPGNRSLAYAEA